MNFADKCAAWHKQFDRVSELYEESGLLIDRLPDGPVVPAALLEGLEAVDGTIERWDGPWTGDALLSALNKGGVPVRLTTVTGARVVTETTIRPLTEKALRRVRELLNIRRDYDRERREYQEQIDRLEAVPNDANSQAWDDALALIREPVATVHDAAEKVKIALRLDVFSSRGDSIDAIFKAVFGDVQKLAAPMPAAGVAA